MKQKMVLVCLLLLAAFGSACTMVSPDAGEEAVIIRKPVFFGHGGVSDSVVKTGRSFFAVTTSAVKVPTIPQRVDMEFDDMMTKSGVPVDFHIVGTFQITDSIKLVDKFGADSDDKGNWGFWIRNIDQPIRTAVRDSVKQREMQEMAIDQSAADKVGMEVRDLAEKIIKETGVPIRLISLSVGRVNPPDAIKNQRVETAAQEQRAITEQQKKLAEDVRKEAEKSRAAADNAYRENMQLSPSQFLQLKQIEMFEKVAGQGATFLIGADVKPVYDVKK